MLVDASRKPRSCDSCSLLLNILVFVGFGITKRTVDLTWCLSFVMCVCFACVRARGMPGRVLSSEIRPDVFYPRLLLAIRLVLSHLAWKSGIREWITRSRWKIRRYQKNVNRYKWWRSHNNAFDTFVICHYMLFHKIVNEERIKCESAHTYHSIDWIDLFVLLIFLHISYTSGLLLSCWRRKCKYYSF